jgi:hypothetical protein
VGESDEDRTAGPVLSVNATPWRWCERPADRSRRWSCCIKRSTRLATPTRGPKGAAACYEMTVLCRSSATPEVPAAPHCHPSRVPSPLIQQTRCASARPRGRAAGRPAWRWSTSWSTPSKPSGDGPTALQEFLSRSCSRESYKTVESADQEGYGGSTNGRPRPR